MKTEVRYVSKSGNTKKVAEAIAGAVGAEAKNVSEPLLEKTDLLFVGGAVYAGGVDEALRAFIDSLTPELVAKAAVFSTSAGGAGAGDQLKKLLEEKGIPVLEEEFSCPGKFIFLHRKRPNEADLAQAAQFAKRAAE